MAKALRAPMTAERLDRLANETFSFCGEPLKFPERAAALSITGRDYYDLIDAMRIARSALEDLAKIESPGGWTENMAARVALHKLNGDL